MTLPPTSPKRPVMAMVMSIIILVFGAMAYAMFTFRKSKGAVPDTGFTHSTKLEAVWTAIPVIILIALTVVRYMANRDVKV